MNKLSLSLLALLPALVEAQPRPTIDAKVVQVVPILSQEMRPRNVEQCRDVEVVTHHRDTLLPSVAGAIIGGLIGSGFGRGHGRAAATGVGAAVGMGVAQNAAQARDHVVVKERCDPVVHYEQVEVQRYQVTYELDGQRFVTTLDRNPGATITVRLAP